jgi:hypothetical protein
VIKAKEMKKLIYKCKECEGIWTTAEYKFAESMFGKYGLIQTYAYPNLMKHVTRENVRHFID